MNPVYPGKDVSYIDTKQAQRAAEVAVRDGELLATLAWLAGAGYPAESLDKAWRQLVFGAHHDAITGTESDQVYLDLLGGWREAWQRGDRRPPGRGRRTWPGGRPPAAGAGAGRRAAGRWSCSTRCPGPGPAWPRAELEFPRTGARPGSALRDEAGGGAVPGRARAAAPGRQPGRGDADVPRGGRARRWATGPTGRARPAAAAEHGGQAWLAAGSRGPARSSRTTGSWSRPTRPGAAR